MAGEIGRTSSRKTLVAWAQERNTTAEELNSRELQIAAADIGSEAVNEWIDAHPIKVRQHVATKSGGARLGSNPWSTAKTSEVAIGKDGTLYFGSNQDGHLRAVNPNGTLKWQVYTGGILHSKPQVHEDGVVSVKVALPFGHDRLIRIHPDGYTLSAVNA